MNRASVTASPARGAEAILAELERIYRRHPTPELGRVIDRLRRGRVERWEITPAGRAALEEPAS